MSSIGVEELVVNRVVLLLGSGRDEDFANPIIRILESFEITVERRVASAHKTPGKVLEILQDNEEAEPLVYITVAGLSNALSGMVDANTVHPVIACPPVGELFGGGDILSSLRMPRGVAPLVVLEPENAALAAAKILAETDKKLRSKVEAYQRREKEKVESDDQKLKK